MSGIRVLVAGASIAGPALAHWLHRQGAEVTVVERAPGLRPGGQAVDARGVAKEVIRRMGLDAAVRAACTDTAGAYTVDVDGNVLETFRATTTAATATSRRSRSCAGIWPGCCSDTLDWSNTCSATGSSSSTRTGGG